MPEPHVAPWAVHYHVEAASLHAHLWRVTMTIAQPAALQTLRLPVWIPGSYMVREFSKHLQQLQCRQADNELVATKRCSRRRHPVGLYFFVCNGEELSVD